MQTTEFKVENRTITQVSNHKLIGIVGQDKFKVNFVDEEWQGLHKTMKLIRSDSEVIYLPMYNDEVVLTEPCYHEGVSQIGFFGTINEDDTENLAIASTDYYTIYFGKHAYDGDATVPSEWDIIIGQMNSVKDDIDDMKTELEAEVQEIEDKLEHGDFKGDKGDKGDKRR